MNKQEIRRERGYAALVYAYRAQGSRAPRHSEAARACGIVQRTAASVWKKGYPSLGLEPIKDAIEREQARAAEMIDKQMEAVDVVTKAEVLRQEDDPDRVIVTEETRLAKASRGAAGAMMQHSLMLLQAAKPLTDALRTKLLEAATNPQDIDVVKSLDLLERIAKLAVKATDVSVVAVRLERLRRGKASEGTLGITANTQADMSVEEAMGVLEDAMALVQRESGGARVKTIEAVVEETEE